MRLQRSRGASGILIYVICDSVVVIWYSVVVMDDIGN